MKTKREVRSTPADLFVASGMSTNPVSSLVVVQLMQCVLQPPLGLTGAAWPTARTVIDARGTVEGAKGKWNAHSFA